jgi:hypothetical protein
MVVDLGTEAGLNSLKARLLALAPEEAFEGVKQRDGNNFPYLKGWLYRRRVGTALPGQEILVFFNGHIERAVVWLEPGAPALAVPPAPNQTQNDPATENAIDLIGEEYLEAVFRDDGKVYICRHMSPAW